MPCWTWGHITETPSEIGSEAYPKAPRSVISFFASPQMELLSRVTHQKYQLRPWAPGEFYARLKEKVEDVWDAIKHKSQEEVAQELVDIASMCCQYYETHKDYEDPLKFFKK